MQFSFADMPAALLGDRIVVRNSFSYTMNDTNMVADLVGEIVISGNSAKYYFPTSNFPGTWSASGGVTSMVSGSLTER